jgi:hypothetical protein
MSDIAKAASNNGMDEVASVLRQEGILANPTILSRYLEVVQISPEISKEANNIASEVFYNLEDNKKDINYEMIKRRALGFVGAISRQDMNKLYEERDQSMSENLKRMMGKPTTSTMPSEGADGGEIDNSEEALDVKEDVSPEMNIADEAYLNPWSLAMLSSIFYILYDKTISSRGARARHY